MVNSFWKNSFILGLVFGLAGAADSGAESFSYEDPSCESLTRTWSEELAPALHFSQSDFSLDDLTQRLNDLLEVTGQKPAVLFSLIRIATTQAPFSPSLADTLAVLGKDRTLQRLATQLSSL